jgi:hypothetical protein
VERNYFQYIILKISSVIYPVGLHPTLQSSGTPCATADGILFYGHIVMDWHIIPAAEKANTAFVGAF